MQTRPPIKIRAGLLVIRALVRCKAIVLALVTLLSSFLKPSTGFLLRYLVIPVYGLFYALRRRTGYFYRPAKNRLMFLITNRYTVHVVVVVITVVTVTVNLGLGQVRAESEAFGQQSILYSLVTNQAVEVIEEYAADEVINYSFVPSFADGALHAPLGGTAALENSTVLLGLGRPEGATPTGLSESTQSTTALATPRTAPISYTVTAGDTLSTISQQFGISLNTLLWANGLTVRSVIKPGMTLAILPVSGVQHAVRSGETLSAIAKKYGVDTDTILAYNTLTSADALKIGQALIIPGGQLIAPIPTTRTVGVRDIFTPAPSGSGGTKTPASGALMAWPTDLRYIVRGKSLYHSGVDIDCNGRRDGSSTNDNYAAMDGIVQFSGARGGYGYAIEIDHGNGLVTRYGHFHSLYVKRGDTVGIGTPLGRCGSTGNSTGTHLHFEVIANGVYKNPANYLGY